MKEIVVQPMDWALGFCTVLPWGFVLLKAFPIKSWTRIALVCLAAIVLGTLSTWIILKLHPLLWPDTDFLPRKKNFLTQTAHVAFIQAGMMEEGFKIFFILLLGLLVAFDRQTKVWKPESVLIAGFVALGFSWVENSQYLARETGDTRMALFLARTVHSANIHLLINLCFGFFLLKSNAKLQVLDKLSLLGFGFLLAVVQHGVVDFLLIPGSLFGQWVATALFVGIWVWVVRDWPLVSLQK